MTVASHWRMAGVARLGGDTQVSMLISGPEPPVGSNESIATDLYVVGSV